MTTINYEHTHEIASMDYLKDNQLPILLGKLLAAVDNLDKNMQNLDKNMQSKFHDINIKIDEQRKKTHDLANSVHVFEQRSYVDDAMQVAKDKRIAVWRWFVGTMVTFASGLGIFELIKHTFSG